MIKIDACALKPTVSKIGNAAKFAAVVLGASLPAALAVDKFESETTERAENKKQQYQFCSDYCMEVLN